MTKFRIVPVVLVLLALGSQTEGKSSERGRVPEQRVPRSKTGAGPYMHLKPVKIYDRQGFEKPIVSRVFLAPVKWKVAGEVYWNIKAVREDHIQEWFHVTHPDRLTRFEKFPQYRWHWSSSTLGRRTLMQLGKRTASLLTPEQAVSQVFLPRFRRKSRARIVSVTPDRTVAAGLQKSLQDEYRKYPIFKDVVVKVDAAIARLQYRVGGRSCEEFVILRTTTIRRPTVPLQLARMADGRTHGYLYECSLDMFAFRAPRGRLNGYKPLFSTMLASMRQNPAYCRVIQQHLARLARIELRGVIRRGKATRKTMAEIAEMHRDSWQKQQASRDRNAVAFTRAIRGVEPYRDPQTGEKIELNFGYDFAYRNQYGEYLITNNQSFNPNVELNGTWRRLQKLRY